jgi:hypothetical protein
VQTPPSAVPASSAAAWVTTSDRSTGWCGATRPASATRAATPTAAFQLGPLRGPGGEVVGAEAPWRAPAAREDPTAAGPVSTRGRWARGRRLRTPCRGLAGYRTGTRAHDQEAFLNADESGPHTPGLGAECARWLAHETPIVGIRGRDGRHRRGRCRRLRSPFPVHSYFLGAGKYGLAQLANLAQLPPTGRSSSWRRSSSSTGRALRRGCSRWSDALSPWTPGFVRASASVA